MSADPLGFINIDYFLEQIAENAICSVTPEILGYFSTMTQHFFGALISYQFSSIQTAGYEFFNEAKELAKYHLTVSCLWSVGTRL